MATTRREEKRLVSTTPAKSRRAAQWCRIGVDVPLMCPQRSSMSAPSLSQRCSLHQVTFRQCKATTTQLHWQPAWSNSNHANSSQSSQSRQPRQTEETFPQIRTLAEKVVGHSLYTRTSQLANHSQKLKKTQQESHQLPIALYDALSIAQSQAPLITSQVITISLVQGRRVPQGCQLKSL